MLLVRGLAVLGVWLVLSLRALAGAELVMIEEAGCMWCARWNAEIAPIYPKTAVGQALPLRRVDISDARRDTGTYSRRIGYTPTFVLVVDGRETGRIEGYPGEDFFWGLLEQIAADAAVDTGS